MTAVLRIVLRHIAFVFLILAGTAHAQLVSAGHLAPSQLAIVINDAKPNSVTIGADYRPGTASRRPTWCTCASPASRAS